MGWINTPHVVVLAGPNGAGKSTVAADLLRDTLGVTAFVNADTIARGLSAFDPDGVAVSAGRVMLERLDELAAARATFAFETTLSTRTVAARLSRLRADGYRVHLVYVWLPDADLTVARVAARVRAGGHNIPVDTARRRFGRSLSNLDDLYRPLADTWIVYDGSTPGRPRVRDVGRSGRAADADPIDRAFADPTHVEAAVGRGTRRAMAVHKRLGQSIVTWRDGQIVTLSPDEIPVGIEESEHPLSRPPEPG